MILGNINRVFDNNKLSKQEFNDIKALEQSIKQLKDLIDEKNKVEKDLLKQIEKIKSQL